ncbi:BfmA/BtgA family mobilization protein [Pedobacter psychrodurus]|uniref:BfmA/BtgA family mobilization protein n=1 Tax=Pedobacter psychrodurus TaxID=2530456 RepID=UPI00292DE656|nr:BfmA/BtgA family mobilization protein [Pedobacter psychrodurus]
MKNEVLRSIKYSEAEGIKLDKIALKLGRSKRLVFLQMTEYFYRTKKDPLDINDDLLKTTMVRNHKDYIGFIKTQENDLLIPTKREVAQLSEAQKRLITGFNGLLKQNEMVPVLMEKQTHFLYQLEKDYKLIFAKLQDKQSFKQLFLNILDGFAIARDNLPAIGSKKDKLQLLAATRNQIMLL